MNQGEEICIDDLCRFCISKRPASSSFIKLKETHLQQFKELTNNTLPLNENYPQYACNQCCVDLENFFCYKKQLITRQEELGIILHTYTTVEEYVDDSQSDIIEEYIDDEESNQQCIEIDDTSNSQSNSSFVEMPSVKNLNKPNSTDIVKLIEEIERKNELIYENTKPTVIIRKRAANKKEKASAVKDDKVQNKHPVERSESLKIQKIEPKLIIQPVINDNETAGIIIYQETFPCNSCSKDFSSEFLLKRHKNQAHPTFTSQSHSLSKRKNETQ